MSDIQYPDLSGLTLYAIDRDSAAHAYNSVTLAYEVYDPTDQADYAITLAEQGASGYYIGTHPAGAVSVLFATTIYLQSGASPAASDTVWATLPAQVALTSSGVTLARMRMLDAWANSGSISGNRMTLLTTDGHTLTIDFDDIQNPSSWVATLA